MPPPSCAGVVHETVALSIPATPDTEAGAPGATARNVKALPAATEAGPGTVTSMFTAPAAFIAGVVMVIVILVLDTTVAFMPPRVTCVAPDKLVPVITTLVPPLMEPVLGVSEINVGVCGVMGGAVAPDATEEPMVFLATIVKV